MLGQRQTDGVDEHTSLSVVSDLGLHQFLKLVYPDN